jgi:hypothetical protein
MTFEDDELSDAAKSLHREWDSPALWPAITREIAAIDARRTRIPDPGRRIPSWPQLAAAAVIIVSIGASLAWLGDRLFRERSTQTTGTARLLNEAALDEVERAEAQYIAAIDALAAKVAREVDDDPASSPLLANLRERLLVIDAAIADCRAEIDHNRFNTHLRRQLLSIYQEKRRTLEQILEQEQHAS